MEEAQEYVSQQKSVVRTLQENVERVEDRIFSDFCRKNKLKDIREYESAQLRFSEETSQRRLEFTTQIAKLENQLQFEQESAKDLGSRVELMEATIEKEEQGQGSFKKEFEKIEQEMRASQSLIEEIEAAVRETQEMLRKESQEVGTIKKHIQDLNKDYEKVNKAIVVMESKVEGLYSEKFSILRRCKIEEIKVPLKEGSVVDFGFEEVHLFWL